MRFNATQDALAANNYRVRVEGLPEGDYQFVVWSGIGNSQYAVSGDTQTTDDFRVSLVTGGDTFAGELPELFHGYLPAVHFDDSYAEHDVELTKDTNQLACLVVPITEETEMTPGDFTMKIVTANGTLDAFNRIATDAVTTYEPYGESGVTIDDADYGELHGLRFNMSTLRLMADNDCRIILGNKNTGETLFNISLPEYIGMIGTLYTNLGREISVQEYLDRQDFYTVVFYLSGDLDQLIQLRVNSWRLRAYNHIKL